MAGFIERLQAALSDLTPLMEEIGAELLQSSQERFETHEAPSGEPWAALAASTVKQRLKKGYGEENILRRKGWLARSLHYQAESDQVTISMGGTGESIAYAATHQFGALIKMDERRQTLYRKADKAGNLKRGFVKRKQSNFAQEVKVGAHTIAIPARPVLGVSAKDEAAIMKIVENYFWNLSYGQK